MDISTFHEVQQGKKQNLFHSSFSLLYISKTHEVQQGKNQI